MRYTTLAVATTWLTLVPFPAIAPTVPGPHAFERAGAAVPPRPPTGRIPHDVPPPEPPT